MNAPLVATPYSTIVWDAKHCLARYVRSTVAYPTTDDIERDGIEVEQALAKAGRVRLLVDLRAVAPRYDPSFELAIAKFRRKLLGEGRQAVVLVRTATGALQVMRHMREDGIDVKVFTREEDAIAFLRVCASERARRSNQERTRPRSRTARRGVLRHVA